MHYLRPDEGVKLGRCTNTEDLGIFSYEDIDASRRFTSLHRFDRKATHYF